MNHNMTTTAFTLDGYRIVETKGVVRGVIVRSRSIVGTLGARNRRGRKTEGDVIQKSSFRQLGHPSPAIRPPRKTAGS